MQLQKEWTSFRITLLLYIVVLLLPFSFYFVSSSFKNMQEDTKIVRQSSWLAGSIGQNIAKKEVNTVLQNISVWVNKNNDTKLYIGAQTLKEDLTAVTSCLATEDSQCYTLADSMALNIEKLVYLKQKKIINVFYISLFLAMIFALLIIYLVRVYIHIQMKKHAIHDHETKLFNKKYCLAELKTSCARAQRYAYPLSMVSISIANIDTYDKKTKQKMLNTFGELMRKTTRISDIACRYDKNHFIILLPDPEENSAIRCQERIGNIFEKYDFNITPKPEFKFSATYYKTDESEEKFMERTLNQLN